MNVGSCKSKSLRSGGILSHQRVCPPWEYETSKEWTKRVIVYAMVGTRQLSGAQRTDLEM
jgi:hypothetical protein